MLAPIVTTAGAVAATEAASKSTEFQDNRDKILADVKAATDAGDHELALKIAQPYRNVDDAEFIEVLQKSQSIVDATKETERNKMIQLQAISLEQEIAFKTKLEILLSEKKISELLTLYNWESTPDFYKDAIIQDWMDRHHEDYGPVKILSLAEVEDDPDAMKIIGGLGDKLPSLRNMNFSYPSYPALRFMGGVKLNRILFSTSTKGETYIPTSGVVINGNIYRPNITPIAYVWVGGATSAPLPIGINKSGEIAFAGIEVVTQQTAPK